MGCNYLVLLIPCVPPQSLPLPSLHSMTLSTLSCISPIKCFSYHRAVRLLAYFTAHPADTSAFTCLPQALLCCLQPPPLVFVQPTLPKEGQKSCQKNPFMKPKMSMPGKPVYLLPEGMGLSNLFPRWVEQGAYLLGPGCPGNMYIWLALDSQKSL